MMTNRQLEIHRGPDELGRYAYTVTWEDTSPAFCSTDGADIREGACVKCGRTGPMPRGQVFFAPLPTWYVNA